jgi:hypothetical protein
MLVDEKGIKRGKRKEIELMRVSVFLSGRITALLLYCYDAFAVKQKKHAQHGGSRERKK